VSFPGGRSEGCANSCSYELAEKLVNLGKAYVCHCNG
jgi:hypothetical protein